MSKNLLVVDWDWFFVNPVEAGSAKDWQTLGLYDWGHAETPLNLSNGLWMIRAAGFVKAGLPLPGVTPPEGGWAAFWNRFTFADDAYCEYTDSNMYAADMVPGDGAHVWDSILIFDAHHDSGYNVSSVEEWLDRGRYSCEDWMMVHHVRGCDDLTVRYPQWKPNGPQERIPDGMPTKQIVDDGQPIEDLVFDAVFICRSGAWVPPWCDRDFLALVDACPVQGFPRDDDEQLDRRFDPADVQRMIDADARAAAMARALDPQS